MTTNINNGQIVKRVLKDAEHKHGIVDAKTIPIDAPCIVAIGGGKTVSRRHANYYASLLNKLLGAYNITNVGIYSAYKSYIEPDRKGTRAKLFKIAQSLVPQHFDITPDTEYIRDLYRHIILPRIVDDNDNRFADDVAAQNLGRVMIVTHCHGAAIVRAFQEMMPADMQKYGYDPRSIVKIMKHLLVIQHAPLAPLHRARFNILSFVSAGDPYVYTNFDNAFTNYVATNSGDMLPSYFADGNFLTASAFTTKNMTAEHDIMWLLPTANDYLTPDGEIIITAERNAIVNGAKSLGNAEHTPLSAADLIAPISTHDKIKPDFDMLAQNGAAFMSLMRYDLHTERSAKKR